MRSNFYQSPSEQEIIMEPTGLFVNRISMFILFVEEEFEPR